MTKRVTNSGAVDCIANREAFKAHSMSGSWEVNEFLTTGRMDRASADILRAHLAAGPVYVVWSYATPIGWAREDGSTVIPDVRFSVTTSKHQGIARRGFYA